MIACSARFEGHNYLTAVHVRIIFFAIVVRMGMIDTNSHSNARVVIFLEKPWHPTSRHLGATGAVGRLGRVLVDFAKRTQKDPKGPMTLMTLIEKGPKRTHDINVFGQLGT